MSSVQRIFVYAAIMAVLLCLAPAALRGADNPAGALRYQLKAGQKPVYDVKIEADLPDGKETLSGHLLYTVKSVDASGQMTLSESGKLTTQKQQKQPAGGRPMMRGPRGGPSRPPMGMMFAATPEVVIDPLGQVIRHNGVTESQLPYLLGFKWQLMVEPLPADEKPSWETRQTIQIQQRASRSGFGGPSFLQQQVNRNANELTTYTLGEAAGGTRVVRKKYELATEEKSGDEPLMQQTGDGQFVFDLQAGLIQSLDMKLTIRISQNNTTVRIPVTVSAKLLSEAEAQKVVADRQAATDSARAAAVEAAKPQAVDDAAITAALEDLKNASGHSLRQACERLEKSIPIEARRAEVAKALEPLLKNSDRFVPVAAARALGVWATGENVPVLISALDERDVFIRMAAMSALGRLKDPRGAEALAKAAVTHQGRREACEALKAMGPAAEPAVVKLLDDRDWAVQMEACKVLAAIGGESSLAPLRAAKGRGNGLVRKEADAAIGAIQSRLAAPAKEEKQ